MAATTPTQIESSAAAAVAPPRKLPIKRKKNPLPPSSQPDPLLLLDPLPKPSSSDPSLAFDDDDDDDDDLDDGDDPVDARSSSSAAAAPPFRFQRVWSESDEIRFPQGLLGCWSQGLLFPRDLNLFFDRFSESMPQPYTRSQLSEKLRRLRKKFRVMSARLARGQDTARLAPHDRDVLHLCTRLWHPSYAASSPFSALAPGSGGNKRRRPNPRAPSGGQARPDTPPQPLATLPPPPPAHEKVGPFAENVAHLVLEMEEKEVIKQEKEAEPLPGMGDAATGKDVPPRHLIAKTILDVFDACLKELKMTASSSGATEGSHLEKRWREQRVAEMDVLARRLRLVLENGTKN